jgi:hypothetical protein
MDSATQFPVLLAIWVVAFMLGKELHTGFAQWWERHRSE